MTTTSAQFYGHGRPPMVPGGPVQQPQPVAGGESRHLGQASEYSSTYDPTLLVPVARQENRDGIEIKSNALPFVGCDVWNAYEVSCLAANGTPVAAVAKIAYPSDSPNIVESKSLKLYLNSFNMTKFGSAKETAAEIRTKMQAKIGMDLAGVTGSNVEVHVFDPDHVSAHSQPWMRSDSERLEDLVRLEEITGELEYTENPDILEIVTTDPLQIVEEQFHSNLLRSNCKVTHQPDWGTVVIAYKGARTVTPESLAKYIISFRNENHFHEEICETIYKRLLDALKPEDLCVACFYTRRGGIDINPIRAINGGYIASVVNDYDDMVKLSPKYPRQ